ncbi:hypothetical protein LguiA_022092 [Lonicera macranthoides]
MLSSLEGTDYIHPPLPLQCITLPHKRSLQTVQNLRTSQIFPTTPSFSKVFRKSAPTQQIFHCSSSLSLKNFLWIFNQKITIFPTKKKSSNIIMDCIDRFWGKKSHTCRCKKSVPIITYNSGGDTSPT